MGTEQVAPRAAGAATRMVRKLLALPGPLLEPLQQVANERYPRPAGEGNVSQVLRDAARYYVAAGCPPV